MNSCATWCYALEGRPSREVATPGRCHGTARRCKIADPFLDNQNVPATRDVQNRGPHRNRGDSHLSYSATVLLLSGRGRVGARGCILRKVKCNALAGLHHAISARKVANARVGAIDRMHDLQVGALVGRLFERVG